MVVSHFVFQFYCFSLIFAAEWFDELVIFTNGGWIADGDVGYSAWCSRQAEGSLAVRVGGSLIHLPSPNLKEV
jgi:hypothetical protein